MKIKVDSDDSYQIINIEDNLSLNSQPQQQIREGSNEWIHLMSPSSIPPQLGEQQRQRQRQQQEEDDEEKMNDNFLYHDEEKGILLGNIEI
jgi:hypothetical protein